MSNTQSVVPRQLDALGFKVGDKCFVLRNKSEEAVVKKIGRRWINVALVGRDLVYEFDRETGRVKGTFFGYTPELRTQEQVRMCELRTAASDAISNLARLVNTCDDPDLLQQIATAATVAHHHAANSMMSKAIPPASRGDK